MELESVNGGCSTTHSGWNYQRLGIQPSESNGQRNEYHPVITTRGHMCGLFIAEQEAKSGIKADIKSKQSF